MAGRGHHDPDVGKTYWVYIMASGPRGVLHVGLTSDLPRRALEHRERMLEGFTQRYGVDRLVCFEAHGEAEVAAAVSVR